MKQIVFTISLYIFLITVNAAFSADTITGKVVGISDGDTITILTNDKQSIKIRLAGIDTPEKSQAFGKKAKQFTSNAVYGKSVTIIQETVDRYKRIVGMVYCGNICLNEKLVKNGLAWVYRKYCGKPHCKEWLQYEHQARINTIGLWSQNDPIPPWDYRRSKREKSNTQKINNYSSVATGNFHGNVKSKNFHRQGCRYYNCKKCTAVFSSRDDAINSGYRPCKNCSP